MTRAVSVAALILFGASVFSETVEPPPLKVRQICGQAFAPDAQIEILRAPHETAIATTTTDQDGRFSFHAALAGRVYLAMPGHAIQDWYPLNISRQVNTESCRRPLYIRPTTGSESAIIVSFKRD